jgi:hypothetical protein
VKVVGLTALPDRRVLVLHKLNVVPVHPNLAFRVHVRNFGTLPEHVLITLEIQRGSQAPAMRHATLILRGKQARAFTFKSVGQVLFAQRENIIVRVDAPSAGPRSRAYPVIFSLA